MRDVPVIFSSPWPTVVLASLFVISLWNVYRLPKFARTRKWGPGDFRLRLSSIRVHTSVGLGLWLFGLVMARIGIDSGHIGLARLAAIPLILGVIIAGLALKKLTAESI